MKSKILNKIEKLEEELFRLKKELKKNPISFEEVAVGEHFKYKDLEFIKLSGKLSILDSYNNIDCIFDNESNDYEASIVRRFINEIALDKMGIDRNDLDPVNDWGDLATLLSADEVIIYKNFLATSKFSVSSWLRSGTDYYAAYAYLLLPSGTSYNYNYVSSSLGIRPLLHFKSSTLVSPLGEEDYND